MTASLLPRAVSRTEGRYGFLRVIYNIKVVPTGSGYDLCVPGSLRGEQRTSREHR